MSATLQPNQFKITRLYDASVSAVWDAWTDLAKVVQWWGPRGFTLTTESKDLRPGGTWRYMMHGPDGTDYPNVTRYHEVDPGKRLVYDHGGSDTAPPLFHVEAVFSQQQDQAQLDMTMTCPTAEAATQIKAFIKQASGNSTWDRLAEFLAKETSGREIFVIARSFPTSLEAMFQKWTEPQQFARWLPPTGATMEILRGEMREGSSIFYRMPTQTGMVMYGRVNYHLLRRPDRLEYTQQFCDENEQLSRHPMAPTWPAYMHSLVRLYSEGPNQTRVAVTWEPEGEVTREELAAFVAARPGMTMGWTGSFDKLDVLLASE